MLSSDAADGMCPLRIDGGSSSELAVLKRRAARAAPRSFDFSLRVLPLEPPANSCGAAPLCELAFEASLEAPSSSETGAVAEAAAAGARARVATVLFGAAARAFLRPPLKGRHATACSSATPSFRGMLQPSANIREATRAMLRVSSMPLCTQTETKKKKYRAITRANK